MHVTFRLPYWTGVLLLAAAPFAGAESPMPEPIAPAVIGRPLDQIRPSYPARPKPAAKPTRPKQATVASKAMPTRRPVPAATARATGQGAPVSRPVAKQVPGHRPDPRTQVAGGPARSVQPRTRLVVPGAYFSSQEQAMVRRYYATTPVSSDGAKWKVGDPLPARAKLTGVPDELRAALPVLPRSHQYVQVDGEVVLVAVQSRTVVDGVSRGMR